MNTTDKAGNKPTPATEQYTTPVGVYSGVPDILYPNTPGYAPQKPVH